MCYCFLVSKVNLKHATLLAILIIILVLIVTFSITKSKQEKTKEENYQRTLQEQKNTEEKDYLMGKFDPAQKKDFILIPRQYTIEEKSANDLYLRKEALDAFEDMAEAADKDNVELKIASATRNFSYQKSIWDSKWIGVTLVDGKNLAKSISNGIERFEKILEYSSVPGTSRHHWGTDIDINDSNPEYFETTKGEDVYKWLVKNALSFGFCQPYNEKESDENGERVNGYNDEKWHWSYLPLSRIFTEEYKNLITDADIKGFDGDNYVPKMNLINNYVLDINPDCL